MVVWHPGVCLACPYAVRPFNRSLPAWKPTVVIPSSPGSLHQQVFMGAQTSLTWTHPTCHPSVAPQSSPNPMSRLTTPCTASQTPASLVPLHLQSNHSHIAISLSPPCAAPLSETLIAAFFFLPCPTPTSLILSSDVNSSRKPSLTDPQTDYTSLTWFPFLCFC